MKINKMGRTKNFGIKKNKTNRLRRKCNICGHLFQPETKFHRFCDTCKSQSELYHFSEWIAA